MSSSNLKFVWNVPNALSLIRLILLPVFAVLYLNSEGTDAMFCWSMGVLLLSGLTDLFDGYFARKLDQITEIGKLLDPLADKLTQVLVLVCLVLRHPELIPLLLICVVKEVLQLIGGLLLFKRTDVVEGSRWFGKVSTFVFYGVMLAIAIWGDVMPRVLFIGLIALVAVLMVFAFFSYLAMYLRLKKKNAAKAPAETKKAS